MRKTKTIIIGKTIINPLTVWELIPLTQERKTVRRRRIWRRKTGLLGKIMGS